jgi:hypothetical protein
LICEGVQNLSRKIVNYLFLNDKNRGSAFGMSCAYCTGMTISDKRLLRHLLTAVLIKLVLLSLLWWLFIRDSHVSVDPNIVGNRFGVPTSTQGASK